MSLVSHSLSIPLEIGHFWALTKIINTTHGAWKWIVGFFRYMNTNLGELRILWMKTMNSKMNHKELWTRIWIWRHVLHINHTHMFFHRLKIWKMPVSWVFQRMAVWEMPVFHRFHQVSVFKKKSKIARFDILPVCPFWYYQLFFKN